MSGREAQSTGETVSLSSVIPESLFLTHENGYLRLFPARVAEETEK